MQYRLYICSRGMRVAVFVASLVCCLPLLAHEVEGDESSLSYEAPGSKGTDSLQLFTDQITGLEKTLGEASAAPNTPSLATYADGTTNALATTAERNAGASNSPPAATDTANLASALGQKEARVGEFTGAVIETSGLGGGVALPSASGDSLISSLGSNFDSVVGSLGSLSGESLNFGGGTNNGALSVAQKVALTQNEAKAAKAGEKAVTVKEKPDANAKEAKESVEPDSKTKFGSMSGDLSLAGMAKKNRDDLSTDKDKKDEEEKKKQKDKEKEKEKAEKLKADMEQEFSQIKDPFKPDDYFKLRKRIHENKNEMDSLTNSNPALKDKTQKVFDKFNSMDGDDHMRQEYADFLSDKRDDAEDTARPSILGPSTLERHLAPQATHLDNPSAESEQSR